MDSGNQYVTLTDGQCVVKGSPSQDESEKLKSVLNGKSKEEKIELTQDFILNHPNSFVSAERLFLLIANDEQSLVMDNKLFDNLAPDVKKSYHGKQSKDILDKKNRNAVGMPALDFTAKEHSEYHLNITGQDTIRLSDFKGKVVLLDFWASWCVPCCQSFPAIKEIYEQTHNQGFEIIAVNTDFFAKNFERWYQAIKETGTENWRHVNVAEDTSSPQAIKSTDIYANYFVQAIPRKILIDRKGVIRANWVGYNEEAEKELKKLVEQLIAE